MPWTPEQKASFVLQQFTAQDSYYRQHLSGVTYDVVEENANPIGRLYVGRWESEVRVVDISLLPEHRGRGIGCRLLRTVIEEAHHAGTKVSINVERFNPARRLYDRLGFVVVDEGDVYLLMELHPAPT